MKFPFPRLRTLEGLFGWAQDLHRALEQELDAEVATPSNATVAVSPLSEPPLCYVPLQFAGFPLVFVTLAAPAGQLVLVGFDPP